MLIFYNEYKQIEYKAQHKAPTEVIGSKVEQELSTNTKPLKSEEPQTRYCQEGHVATLTFLSKGDFLWLGNIICGPHTTNQHPNCPHLAHCYS